MTATGGGNHAGPGWPKPRLSGREDSNGGVARQAHFATNLGVLRQPLRDDVGGIDLGGERRPSFAVWRAPPFASTARLTQQL